MNNLNINPLVWIQQGKTVQIDEQTGILKPNGLKENLYRWFVPNFAERQDIAVARFLIQQLDKIPPGANSTNVSKLADVQNFKAAASFMKKNLSFYKGTTGAISVCKERLQYLLDVEKLSKKFNIPYEDLKQNPTFVNFAIINHLHHRIDSSYTQRQIGVQSIDGKIYLMKRCYDSVNNTWTKMSEMLEWDKLPTDSKGRIDGWELMAYGWQPYDRKKATKFEPVKIITLKENEDQDYAIELVTAKPTYNLSNLGLGMFGHSWLRVYEPIKDINGKSTNVVAVYSIGYNLENLVTPDIFECIDREFVSTKHTLKAEEFEKAKNDIESLLEAINGDAKEQSLPRTAFQYWFQSNCITCSSFASQLFQEITGIQIDGRLLLMKTLIPNSWRFKFTQITKNSPGFIKSIISKIKFLTHGYFPSVMIDIQNKLAKASTKNQKFYTQI